MWLTITAPLIFAAYSQALTASGGSGPYTFTLASGSLPTGVTLSSAGVISELMVRQFTEK